jgi:hypothetical protein
MLVLTVPIYPSNMSKIPHQGLHQIKWTSLVAQGKSAGLITRRSLDRNQSKLKRAVFCSTFLPFRPVAEEFVKLKTDTRFGMRARIITDMVIHYYRQADFKADGYLASLVERKLIDEHLENPY